TLPHPSTLYPKKMSKKFKSATRYNVRMDDQPVKPVTMRTLQRTMAEGGKFAVLTCYDAVTARWLQRAGVPMLLVGDTAAEMVLGEPSTIHAPLEFMLLLTAAVKRGAPQTLIMGDMPFMSYQADDAEAVRNAGRFLTEGRADLVKLEVDASHGDLVAKLANAGIPVVAHIGSRPQQVRKVGGYRSAGKTAAEALAIVEQAELMEARGAVMLLVEATAAEVTDRIVQRVKIPVIGCGAGPACHGHVVVLHDLLGLSDWQPPFAKPQAQVGQSIQQAAGEWVKLVAGGSYLQEGHPYKMDDREREKFLQG
ncbi:MAG: 3-methyl-2-oxobutanoate hydroxymethyltransferase, partial [Phycisphaeraceae bacterium]